MAVPVDLFPRTSSVFTDYCTTEGQVIYRVEAHSRWNVKTIHIRKVVSGSQTNEGNLPLKDEFEEVGRVEIGRFSEHTVALPSEEPGQLGFAAKASRIFKRRGWPKIEGLEFTGPNGKVYEWRVSPFQVKLYPTDNEEESCPILIYPHLVPSPPSGSTPSQKDMVACLRVEDQGRQFLDFLFVSFVYAETMRRKQEPRLAGVNGQIQTFNWLVPLR